MASFKDNSKREWLLSIDVFLLERVETATAVKIGKLFEDNAAGLVELLGEPVKFVRVLWLLVEDEAKAKSVTPEQFGRALAGDALEEAASAFVDAVADFSPSRPRRLIRQMVSAGKEVAERLTERALKTIETEKAKYFSSVTNSPESSESMPGGAG